MSTVARAAWRAGAGGAAWVLGGYPLALAALPARPWARGPARPSVSVVVPAVAEREALGAKLASIAALDYPAGRVETIVAVDRDEPTAAIARAAGAEVLFSPQRRGKAAALRAALERARGDAVLLTDANNLLAPGALAAAAEHLADPDVWAVAGRRGEQGSAYDRYEDLLRRLESRSGSVAAASGEFLLVRAERLPEIPAGVVNDDLWLLCELVRRGGRVVYEPRAASTEPPLPPGAEVERRTRMAAGRVLLLREIAAAPRGHRWRLASHKVGRLALPPLLLAAWLGALLGGERRLRGPALAQTAFYALGAASAAGLEPPGPARRPARVARQFLLGNVATASGVVRALRGRQPSSWQAVR